MTRIAMVALKPMAYATRRLKAGDEFEAKPAEATVLRHLGHARDADRAPPPRPAPPAEIVDLDTLRARFEAASGRRADRRWGANRLATELAAL
jgi:hypothetical protein